MTHAIAFRTPFRRALAGATLAATLLTAALAPASAGETVDTSRVVSIGGSLTEIVFALGAGESVVGVDQTSMWPPATQDLPNVGYYKMISAEGVVSLGPTVVLSYADAEPAEALTQIEATGIPVVPFERHPLLPALRDNVTRIGALFDREDAATDLLAEIDGDLAAVRAAVASVEKRPKVLFVISYDQSQMVVAGAGSVADQLITLAGGDNVAGSLDGYKPFNAEVAATAAPDVILTVAERWDSMGGAEGIAALPGLADTPAARSGRIGALPGSLELSGERHPDGRRGATQRPAGRAHLHGKVRFLSWRGWQGAEPVDSAACRIERIACRVQSLSGQCDAEWLTPYRKQRHSGFLPHAGLPQTVERQGNRRRSDLYPR